MRLIFQHCPTRPRARATGAIFLALALTLGAMLTPAGGARAEARFEGKDRQAIEEIVREYLIENPEVLIEAMRVLEQREQNAALASRREAIEKRHADIYNDPGDFVAGNPKGDVTIVEFFDYRCGYCKQSFKPLMDFVKADGNIRLILKEFPILGPASLEASKAAIAAKKQNRYLEMHQALYEHKGQLDSEAIFGIATSLGLDTAQLRKDMEDPAIAEMVSRHYDLAEALGVDGTPAFIVGGELYPGAADKERLTEIVKTARGG